MNTTPKLRYSIADLCHMLCLSRSGLNKLRAKDPSLAATVLKQGTCRQSTVYFDAEAFHAWYAAQTQKQAS